jgi:hydroxyacylglutathione hydrolase
MYFKHFFEDGLAQNSYLVGCQATGEAIAIDPSREIAPYLATAAAEGLKIDRKSVV